MKKIANPIWLGISMVLVLISNISLAQPKMGPGYMVSEPVSRSTELVYDESEVFGVNQFTVNPLVFVDKKIAQTFVDELFGKEGQMPVSYYHKSSIGDVVTTNIQGSALKATHTYTVEISSHSDPDSIIVRRVVEKYTSEPKVEAKQQSQPILKPVVNADGMEIYFCEKCYDGEFITWIDIQAEMPHLMGETGGHDYVYSFDEDERNTESSKEKIFLFVPHQGGSYVVVMLVGTKAYVAGFNSPLPPGKKIERIKAAGRTIKEAVMESYKKTPTVASEGKGD